MTRNILWGGILGMALCLCVPQGTVWAQEVVPVSNAETQENLDFSYRSLSDGTMEIKKYLGSDSTVMIPETIEGKTVTSIGESAFGWCSSLTEITIPSSVTSIGGKAM